MAENSTDDNSNVSNETLVDMDDLDKFEDAFYGRVNESKEEYQERVEDRETEDDSLATSEDQDAEAEAETEVEDEGESKEEEAPPKKNRKSAKERIEELVAEARVAERERDAERQSRLALEARLQALEASQKQVEKPQAESKVEDSPPNPNAVNDKGEPLYPLGEFDPKFVYDLSRFAVAQETKAFQERQKAEAEARQEAERQAALRQSWEQKVEKVKEELPDYQEKVSSLASAFGNIEPEYGNYLATTIMNCDNGPEIMYYLSQNIGEAQKIVASGPFAATLEIGRLQAKLERPAKEAESNKTKIVSDAPPPPNERVRGRGGQFATRPDTDDLDAFEKEFFNRR